MLQQQYLSQIADYITKRAGQAAPVIGMGGPSAAPAYNAVSGTDFSSLPGAPTAPQPPGPSACTCMHQTICNKSYPTHALISGTGPDRACPACAAAGPTARYFPKLGYLSFDAAQLDKILAKIREFAEGSPMTDKDFEALQSLAATLGQTNRYHASEVGEVGVLEGGVRRVWKLAGSARTKDVGACRAGQGGRDEGRSQAAAAARRQGAHRVERIDFLLVIISKALRPDGCRDVCPDLPGPRPTPTGRAPPDHQGHRPPNSNRKVGTPPSRSPMCSSLRVSPPQRAPPVSVSLRVQCPWGRREESRVRPHRDAVAASAGQPPRALGLTAAARWFGSLPCLGPRGGTRGLDQQEHPGMHTAIPPFILYTTMTATTRDAYILLRPFVTECCGDRPAQPRGPDQRP